MSITLPPAGAPPASLGLPEEEIHGVSLWRGAFRRVLDVGFVVLRVREPPEEADREDRQEPKWSACHGAHHRPRL